MVLYPNKLPESERVCSGICRIIKQENGHAGLSSKDYLETVNSDIVISFRNFKSVRVPFEK